MEDDLIPRASQRLAASPPASLLLVGGDEDLRLFLRASLQRWYQLAEAPTGEAAVPHLAHCPPQGLIVGALTGEDEAVLRAECEGANGPPVLKLWSTSPPAGWVDHGLRHPFTRADLLRASDRLVCGDAPGHEGNEQPELFDVRLEACSEA